MDPDSPEAKISAIFISKDDILLQNLYVIYWKKFEENKSFIKVFKQTSQYQFKEFKDSGLNMLEIYSHSQPMMLDIDGDLM